MTILPHGVKDILPNDSSKMRFVEEVTLDTFSRWGYRRVITPIIEYEDILSKGIDNEIKGEILKFVEPETGRILALRPDITPQIARMMASRMRADPMPVRLCYSESVFRCTGRPTMKHKEIFQSGAELIGLGLSEADGEIVAIAIEAMKSLSLQEFKIDIGDVGFLGGILEDIEIEEGLKNALMKSIALKDRSGLEQLLRDLSIDDLKKRLLIELPSLYGKGEEVLKRASCLVKNRRSLKALNNLEQILNILELYGLKEFITVDLGEVSGFDYYSGMVFEGFVKGIGRGIVRGGRYDNLLEQYGYSCPAVGFAFDVDGLLNAMDVRKVLQEEDKIDFLLFSAKEEKKEALDIAMSLREKKYTVARDIIKRDYEASFEYSVKNRIDSIISLGLEGLDDDMVMLEKVMTREKREIKIKDILQGIGL
ncbi:MAG: ATP phosphoribosyltransferase regulatory subunit [Thermodesulfobacteriota bacterium]